MPFVERVIPVLTVKSLKRSRAFYKTALGFEIEWGGDEGDAKGVKIVLEPRNMPWAYEMKIEDEDGNILWLGTESKKPALG